MHTLRGLPSKTLRYFFIWISLIVLDSGLSATLWPLRHRNLDTPKRTPFYHGTAPKSQSLTHIRYSIKHKHIRRYEAEVLVRKCLRNKQRYSSYCCYCLHLLVPLLTSKGFHSIVQVSAESKSLKPSAPCLAPLIVPNLRRFANKYVPPKLSKTTGSYPS